MEKTKKIIIVEYNCSNEKELIIGVCWDKKTALELIRDYYGKEAIESKFTEVKDSEVEFYLTINLNNYKYIVTAMDYKTAEKKYK